MNQNVLTDPEQQLVEHVMNGTFLDFASGDELDSTVMPTWSADRTIRATVIRDILLGRLATMPDPRGLQLRGARISGRLDLTHVKTDIPVKLIQCFLEEGLEACFAHIPILMLAGSHLSHGSIAALDISNLHTDLIALNGMSITSSCTDAAARLVRVQVTGSIGFSGTLIHNAKGPAIRADGLLVERNLALDNGFAAEGAGGDAAIRLVGAEIGGEFICVGATIQNKSGAAMAADKIHVGQSVHLSGRFTAIGAGENGAVRLAGAVIGGQLSLTGAVLRNDSGPALYADRIQVQDDIYMRNGFVAAGSGKQGALVLPGARVDGHLICADAKIENRSGPALVADGVQVEQDVEFHHVQITGEGDRATVRLCDARIGGKLGLATATLHNGSGSALDGDRIHVRQGIFIEPGLQVTGAGQYGAVRLHNAKVDANLQFIGARLSNSSGPALSADGMQVAGNLELCEGFTAIGNGDDGAVRILGAQIGDSIQLLAASFQNEYGPALSADRAHVAGNVVLTDNCNAIGSGHHGAIRLLGVRIDGQLRLDSGNIHNESGPALAAAELQVNQSVMLNKGLDVVGGGSSSTLELSSVRISGNLVFDPGRIEHKSDTKARLNIDGLTYTGVPATRPDKDWLELIRHWTRIYSAQPYQQLAAAHRLTGHDKEARDVLIAQRHDQVDRGNIRLRGKIWARLLSGTLGYGYKPGRALWWFTGVIVVAFFLTVALGRFGGIAVVDSTGITSPCSIVEQMSIAIDMSVPLIDPGSGNRCQITTNTAGQMLTAAGWILQLLAWAFTTLFVAGFTGIVRKI